MMKLADRLTLKIAKSIFSPKEKYYIKTIVIGYGYNVFRITHGPYKSYRKAEKVRTKLQSKNNIIGCKYSIISRVDSNFYTIYGNVEDQYTQCKNRYCIKSHSR